MQAEELTALARRYFEFFNNPKGTVEELSQFLSPQIVWREMPNKFAPAGRTTQYEVMLKNFQIGQNYISPQTYVIDRIVVQGDIVAVELSWRGNVVETLGPFPAGSQLTAQVASFLKFENGLLISQTDYPCYPPTEVE